MVLDADRHGLFLVGGTFGLKEEDVRARLGDRIWYLYAEPNCDPDSDLADDDDSSLLGAAGVATHQTPGPEGPDADETVADMSIRRAARQLDLNTKAVRWNTGASNASERA